MGAPTIAVVPDQHEATDSSDDAGDNEPERSARRLSELDRRHRRRKMIRTGVAVAVAWILVIGIYYVLPFTDLTSGETVVRLVLGIVAFVVVLAWQLRRIKQDDLPELRAIRALGVIIPVLLVVFAAVYLSLDEASTTHFSEPINHTGALYLTITVFSTVGFGDITPETDLARAIVSFQTVGPSCDRCRRTPHRDCDEVRPQRLRLIELRHRSGRLLRLDLTITQIT